MERRIMELTKDMDLREASSEGTVRKIQKALGIVFPEDYASFMAQHNGGEGWVGNSYLLLWRVDKIASKTTNTGYAEFYPGLFLFGSDGGGEAYAFDARSGETLIVEVPYVGGPDHAIFCGRNFVEFLEFLHSRVSSEEH
ncbi:MAG TPA: SMI1/KNR4 family protein [Chloroflexia bacterium]|jgi:hypothetical protein